MNQTEDPPIVLDEVQAKRIEAVHRGFLYQHLYAAGCLLLASGGPVNSVIVEKDEDIELSTSKDRFYLQVKTRSEAIIPSDIAGALERFDEIRIEHKEGRRSGRAIFGIIVNMEPGPLLSKQIAEGKFPDDVTIEWPGHDGKLESKILPPAWASLSDAVQWCLEKARSLPYTVLEPETLVWKLAGRVLLAATGDKLHPDHAFQVADLPALFEQLLIQFQEFPQPPVPYHPQEGEPVLDSEKRVRIICGFSGAGKTAWAAQSALLSSCDSAYYDVGDVPGSAIAPGLVREVAAQRMRHSGGQLSKLLMPGVSGREALQALDAYLLKNQFDTLVVIDNAHRVPVDDLRLLVEATKHIRLVFLCQPSKLVQQLESACGIEQEPLQGWNLDTIALEIDRAGARANPQVCDRLRTLTGGFPLYVQGAIRVALSDYDGHIENLCTAIEAQTHVMETAQELILDRVFERLPKLTQDVLAVLSLSDVPITYAEVSTLATQSISLEASQNARSLRELRAEGLLQTFGNQRLRVHDSLRLIAQKHFEYFEPDRKTAAYESLKNILVKSVVENQDTLRFRLLVRVFVKLGDVKTLVSLAQEEMFHELGLGAEITPAMESAISVQGMPAEQKFWALDGLVFGELNRGDLDKLPDRLLEMKQLISDHSLGSDEQLAYLLKDMIFSAKQGKYAKVAESVSKCAELLPEHEEHQRIFRYNTAVALWQLKRYSQAEQITRPLIKEYLDVLGLKQSDVDGKNCDYIWQKVKVTEDTHIHLKHLGDTLELCARAINGQGGDAGTMRLHSTKFYNMCGAGNSLIRVAQDVADECIKRNDFIAARWMMENMLVPAIVKHNMVAHLVPVRSQYAVILAYCGEPDAADREMRRLVPYVTGLDSDQRKEIEGQQKLIASLRVKRPPQRIFGSPPVLISGRYGVTPQNSPRHRKVGPNERCPCGSGKKFKKCYCGLRLL